MNSSQKSQLLSNISRYALDSRIGKTLLLVKGTSARMGERISSKAGYSPVIMDYRYYQKGDAVKDIDWKLSARTEKLYVKIREGYRQTDFIIVLDGSGSMRTIYNGSVSKFTTALTLAYIAGRSALKSRDRVYISYAGEKLRAETEYSLVDLLTDIETRNAEDAFRDSGIDSSTNVFMLSDFFIETDTLSNYLKALSHKTKNIFMISIHDPCEENFNFNGRFRFFDPESESSVLAESRNISERYHHLYNEHNHIISRTGKSFGAKVGKVSTIEDPLHAYIKAVS
jgi:uncharacterized protein (DUF58 family)